MEKAPLPDSFALGIHAMPGTNRCRHCWTEGSAQHARVPAAQVYFALGNLGGAGLRPLLESYRRAHPRALRLLDQVTWGELARRYGDRENDELYHLSDLPENKWAAAYLLEECS